jgi:hypothetical protein
LKARNIAHWITTIVLARRRLAQAPARDHAVDGLGKT